MFILGGFAAFGVAAQILLVTLSPAVDISWGQLAIALSGLMLAIEPMSCASDGFNHPEWGLTRLSTRDVWVGTWGVRATTLDGLGS